MIKDRNFIHIEAFMVKQLGLKGNDLLVYAIIYGFSQDGKTRFTESLDYLAEWTNSTVQGCLKNLNSLIDKGLIIKSKKGNFCEYWVNPESEIKQSSIRNEQSGLNKVEMEAFHK